MKSRLFILAVAVFMTASAFAGKPIRRTIVIKDGKVITDQSLEGLVGLTEIGGKRGYLGVSLIDVSSELRENLGAARDAGVLVNSVEDGGPADKAGIRAGDLILSVDGSEVKSSIDLRDALREKKDGDSVRVELLRGRSRSTVVASVVERDGPRVFFGGDFEALTKRIGSSPEWHARVESFSDCDELRSRIKDLEARLKDLEKKLQK
jgi:membrane-associated protease RseP (regulator of RpoE activity)